MLHGTKTVIKHKIGLLNLAEKLGNVSRPMVELMVRFWAKIPKIVLNFKP